MRKMLYPRLYATICEILDSHPEPDESRLGSLTAIGDYILSHPNHSDLMFVCTHNSRRSHMAQLWALAAAEFYDLNGIRTFSAGTEVTAMHPYTVEALVSCGFEVSEPPVMSSNPGYLFRLGGLIPAIRCFSKVFNHESLPENNFCAVLVCDEAAEVCPVVPGAASRIPLSFNDPKSSDNTPQRRTTYLSRSKEIAREMLWIMEYVHRTKK